MAEQDREFALLCPHCGEENPPEFPVCWSCHGDLPAAAPAAEEGGVPPQPGPAIVGATRRKRIQFEVAAVLAVVWVPWFASGIWSAVEPTPSSLASELWHTVHGAGLLALLFYLAWLDGDWRRRLGLARPRIASEILWGLGLWVAMNVANAIVFRITTGLGLEEEPSARRAFEGLPAWIAPVYFLIFAWVEEVFYRAYLWSRLTELSGRPRLSIAISSALFAAAHVYPLDASLGIFFGGVFLGWAFAVRRSLWAPVLGHWLFNLVVVFVP